MSIHMAGLQDPTPKLPPMLPFFFLFFLFLLGPTPSSAHYSYAVRYTIPLRLSSLAWDPIDEHYLAGSSVGPTIYSISDAGKVQCLLSDISPNSTGAFVAAVAVDDVRHHLIVAFSNSSSVAAYDLRSYRKICALPLPQLDGAPGGVAVDTENGEVFVTSSRRGIVLKVRLDGDGSLISEYEIKNDQGLGGVVHVNDQNPYILVRQTATGKIFKIGSKDGIVNEVLSSGKSNMLAPNGSAIALHTDLSLTVAANQNLLLLKSDGSWSRASVNSNTTVGDQNQWVAVAVATKQGKNLCQCKKAYVLIDSPSGYRIMEVRWRKLGLYWRLYLVLYCIILVVVVAMLYKVFTDWKNGSNK